MVRDACRGIAFTNKRREGGATACDTRWRGGLFFFCFGALDTYDTMDIYGLEDCDIRGPRVGSMSTCTQTAGFVLHGHSRRSGCMSRRRDVRSNHTGTFFFFFFLSRKSSNLRGRNCQLPFVHLHARLPVKTRRFVTYIWTRNLLRDKIPLSTHHVVYIL